MTSSPNESPVTIATTSTPETPAPDIWSALNSQTLTSAFTLLYNGANPNSIQESTGQTPLHVASHHGNVALSMLLFSKGAELNSQGLDGRTPVHIAAAGGYGQLVTFLVKAGAKVSLADVNGNLPEDLADRANHRAIHRLLVNARGLETARRGGSSSTGAGEAMASFGGTPGGLGRGGGGGGGGRTGKEMARSSSKELQQQQQQQGQQQWRMSYGGEKEMEK